MDRRFLLIVTLIIGGFLGVFWFSKNKGAQNGTQTLIASQHTQGAGKKGVTLIEYGDFQCPACGAYFPVLKQIKSQLGDDITFQFRNFPLIQIHSNAMAAHRAAEAAHIQGKFWEMHDLLYERQSAWTSSKNVAAIFEGYAQELALDMARYKQDVVSQNVNSIIQADIKEGQKLGATSTPTFVLNGRKIEELPRSADAFIKLIQDEISKQNQ